MRDREIKLLFEKANNQVLVNETRKQDAYMKLANEMDKQRVTLMSRKNILLSYFLYMDKVYFAAYAVLLCLGFVLISVLDNMGIERDGYKLHISSKELEQMKQVTNDMCRERGFTIAEKGKHFDGTPIEAGTITSWSKDKYNMLRNANKESFLVG